MRTGVSVLCAAPQLVGAMRLGLLTNYTGVMPDLRRNVDAMLEAGIQIRALLGPEHGLRGIGQAGQAEPDDVDVRTGLPVLNTYGKDEHALAELFDRAGVDALVFDLQDVGVRFWTYAATLYDCMLAAARTGKHVVVLDRPNPIGGTVTSGPRLDPRFSSFVGRVDIPVRHGLTIGELAMLYRTVFLPQAGLQVDLEVVRMAGWRRDLPHPGTAWVPPSPNMPTRETALAFCGTGLFEGTTVSEGRGTTRPFEMIGAPYVDGRLVDTLRDQRLPGVTFREAWFRPTFHKYAGETVRGVQLHVHDRVAFEPVSCALTMVWAFATLYPERFTFPTAQGELGPGHTIDRLWGSDDLRLAVEAGQDARTLARPPVPTVERYPRHVLQYP